MKYEFHVGDYVEDVTGRIGYINSICQCKRCKERGFYEPHVMYNNGDCDYITAHECEKGFPSYKRIGQYAFTQRKKVNINRLEQQGYLDPRAMITTINELVDAVNRIEEKLK